MRAALIGLVAGLVIAWQSEGAEPKPRIVVAGGDLTEIVFALGEGENIVGVDQTSTWPEATTDLPQIGYVRRLAPEGILSLAPDLVLLADDAGPQIALDQLTAAGVDLAKAPPSKTVDAIPEKIAFVGAALDREAEARALVKSFQQELDAVRSKISTLPTGPQVLFILSIQGGAPLVGGRDTTADEMIRLAGAENAGAMLNGYKPMNKEAILAAAPDVILMMDQHATRAGGIEGILSRPEIALTPAGQAGRAVTMEGMLLLGFGPRTPEAVAKLARELHPGAAAKAGL